MIADYSCKNAKQNNGSSSATTYKLALNPVPGSVYYYDISSSSETKLEVNDRKIDNSNKTEAGVIYEISKDSTGNILLKLTYDKFKVTTKNGDDEKTMDAANAATSIDPTEKMLGMLKGSTLLATINKKGEVISITGYKEMLDKIMASVSTKDLNAKKMMQGMFSQLFGEGFVKKNLEQGFKLFPDSAVHVGNSWDIASTQASDIKMKVSTKFTLESVDNGIVSIESKSDMASDSASSKVFGYDVQSNLKGKQEGSFHVDSKTGMLLSNETSSAIEGTIQMLGRDVPVTIKTATKINGHKM